MRIGDTCWDALVALAANGSMAMRSDLEVGARALETGIWGCCRNVLINLGDIEDGDFVTATKAEAERLSARASSQAEEVLRVLESRTE
jgi:glutamate formiminotransferase/formiminotetrahydrofolate cyclodeaminase